MFVKRFSIYLATLVSLIGVIAIAGPAHATPAPTPPSRNESVVQEVAMVLDCSSLSGSAAKYAVEHGICTKDGRALNRAPGEVGTLDERTGSCGTSRLYWYDAGYGHAGFQYGSTSSLGAVAHHSLTIKWANHDESTQGSVGDSAWPWSSVYANTQDPFTGSGYVTSAMTGSVTLVWGAGCTLLSPTSSGIVSW